MSRNEKLMVLRALRKKMVLTKDFAKLGELERQYVALKNSL